MVFGKRRHGEVSVSAGTTAEITANKLDTIIGKGATVNGTIKTDGTLRIDGKLEGEINVAGDLIIGETGVVNADVVAQNITVAGMVKGNIKASGKLDLKASGKIFGDITVKDLAVAQGALLQGEVCMTSPDSEKTKPAKQ